VEAVMWVLAVMPASKLKADAVGGINIYTNMALSLHDYRYNGPDPEGVLSPCPSDEVAAHDVKKLVAKVEEPANGPSLSTGHHRSEAWHLVGLSLCLLQRRY
jgi:hypothetical protein